MLKSKKMLNVFGGMLFVLPFVIVIVFQIVQEKYKPDLIVLNRLYSSMGDMNQVNHYNDLYLFNNSLLILTILPVLFFCLIVYPYYTKQEIPNKQFRLISLCLLSIISLTYILTINVYGIGIVAIILVMYCLFYFFRKHREPLFLKWYKHIFSLLMIVMITLTVFVSLRVMKTDSLAIYPETIVINQDATLLENKICQKWTNLIKCAVNKKEFLSNYSVTSIQLLISEENYKYLKDKSYSIKTFLGMFVSETYDSIQVEQIDQRYLLTVQTNLNLRGSEEYFSGMIILTIYLKDEIDNSINMGIIDEYRITFTKNN